MAATLSNRASVASVPLFLVPAFTKSPNKFFSRTFGSTPVPRSKVGRNPLSVPPEVTISVTPKYKKRSTLTPSAPRVLLASTVDVEGPLGRLSLSMPAFMTLRPDDTGRAQQLSVAAPDDKRQRAMWGTVRSHIQNNILGVSEGHNCVLRMVGVGYRATLEKQSTTKTPSYHGQEFLVLKAGFSHPIEMGVPEGIKVVIPQPTKIIVEGCDKDAVTLFAACIRACRKPEPYKGKGIFVNDETIRLKGKKAK